MSTGGIINEHIGFAITGINRVQAIAVEFHHTVTAAQSDVVNPAGVYGNLVITVTGIDFLVTGRSHDDAIITVKRDDFVITRPDPDDLIRGATKVTVVSVAKEHCHRIEVNVVEILIVERLGRFVNDVVIAGAGTEHTVARAAVYIESVVAIAQIYVESSGGTGLDLNKIIPFTHVDVQAGSQVRVDH